MNPTKPAEFIPPIAPTEGAPLRALVLAGGGMRVAYQAGAVKALVDDGLRFSHADATSGGALNLAALLSGVTPDDLCRRWRQLPVRWLAHLQPLRRRLKPLRLAVQGDASSLAEHIYPALGVDLARLRQATGIDGTFNVCRFAGKSVVAIPQRSIDLSRLLAAISLPMFQPAVEADGSAWTDAVWIRGCNLLSCIERGARELWLVWCHANTPRWRPDAFDQYNHMIEMSATGALDAQLAEIEKINARIAAGESVWGHREPIVVYIVKPEVPLPLEPEVSSGRIDAATLIDMGYRDARRALRHRYLSPSGPGATQTAEPAVGVSFRERMAGGFTLGATQAVEGRHSDERLAINVCVHIEDIDRFVQDPLHQADLTGHIDFAPWGQAIPADRGRFQLFGPSGDGALTYMVYELGFQHAGRSYYLSGKKHVRISNPLNLWPQTTTLYTTLHEGIDSAGPVVGAGVLSLGVPDLLKLLGTLHARRATDLASRVGAIGRFFRFFASELVRTYVLRRPLKTTPELEPVP